MNPMTATETVSKDGFYFVILDDINKIFEIIDPKSKINTKTFQLKVEADSEKDAILQVDNKIESGNINIVDDVLFDDPEIPEERMIIKGDFVGYKTGEHEQDLTYLIVLNEAKHFKTTIECYDPWFDAYVEIEESDVWLMTNREKTMSANHAKYGMVIVADIMFKEAERVMNLDYSNVPFNKVIEKV